MAQKRKHEEDKAEAEDYAQPVVHESRQVQVYGSNTPKAAKKPRKSEPHGPRTQVHATSVNAIKKRIRDVTRKLARSDGLPADVRVEDERALATYEQELAAAEAEVHLVKMIARYKMVRFFEHKKATRLAKRLRKQLLSAKSTEEVEDLKEQLRIAEVDINYAYYCPLSEVYVALYPNQEHTSEDASTTPDQRSKPPLWSEVEKHMEAGTLSQLRHRASTIPIKKPKKPNNMVKPTKPEYTKAPVQVQKPKAQAPPVDMTGMNRRQRRKLGGITQVVDKSKNKSVGFEKNKAFGAAEEAKTLRGYQKDDEGSDGGGFFEE